jgi:hypothetical protein
VSQDLLDHRPLKDAEFPAAAVRAVLHVDVESEASAQTNLYSSYVAAKRAQVRHGAAELRFVEQQEVHS